MKTTPPHSARRRAGFSLLEIMTVIVILAILISITIPVIIRSKVKAMAGMAQVDCSTISGAIKQYYDDYKRYPMRKGQKANTPGGDLTFAGSPPNSDAIITLIAMESLGGNDVNKNHRRNYKKTRYFEPKLVNSIEKGGIGPDGVFRDPFGNPYVISVDFNNDDKCNDLFYGQPAISGGGDGQISYFGLVQEAKNGVPLFFLSGQVMVWSAGPDQSIDPGANAMKGANHDNIIGWPR